MRHDPRIGFFGKLPSHGDFVRRSLAPDLVSHWDAWLQAGLSASRQALGDDWLDCYLSSPIWRFALSGGICGADQWIGVMMPSVDRVGRYFPLTVAGLVPAEQSLFSTALEAGTWLSEVEAAMLRALSEDGVTADVLATQLASIAPLAAETDAPPAALAAGCDGESYINLPLADSARLQDAANALTEALAMRCYGRFSLWWSAGSAYVAPCARIYPDLPREGLFGTLLRSGPIPEA